MSFSVLKDFFFFFFGVYLVMLSIIFFFFLSGNEFFYCHVSYDLMASCPCSADYLIRCIQSDLCIRKGEKIIPAELEELQGRSFTFIFAHDHR